jgi:hypothetical protein
MKERAWMQTRRKDLRILGLSAGDHLGRGVRSERTDGSFNCRSHFRTLSTVLRAATSATYSLHRHKVRAECGPPPKTERSSPAIKPSMSGLSLVACRTIAMPFTGTCMNVTPTSAN